MTKLAIVVSHPIQYYAPLFKVLAKELKIKVFYCHNPNANEIGQDGFAMAFKWDIELLEGYEYEFLENRSEKPSVSNYLGCDTPDVGDYLQRFGTTHVVVFGWYLKALRQTVEFCNKNKIPIAARGDSQLNPHQVFYKRLIKKYYYPFFLKKFDAFLYVGERNREYLKYYGVGEEKLIFSPHAVDQEFWSREGNSQKSAFSFLWVGKFIEKKRPLDVIKAFQETQGQMGTSTLTMVGTGSLLEQCKEAANGNSRIQFDGFKNQTELKELYQQADAIVLCSNYEETWGLVINEAFSYNIPALVSNACGCSVDLITSETGFVFQLGDIKALGNGLIKLYERLQSRIEIRQMKKAIHKKNRIYSYQTNINSFQLFLSREN